MKRPKAIQSAIAIALPGLLAVLIFCWVLSYGCTFSLGRESWSYSDHRLTRQFKGLLLHRGGFGFGTSAGEWTEGGIDPSVDDVSKPRIRFRTWEPFRTPLHPENPDSLLTRAGFQWLEGRKTVPAVWEDPFAMAPMWFLILLVSGPMGLWYFKRERGVRRLREGRCRTCGYDLRATPGRCPECGTMPAEPAA